MRRQRNMFQMKGQDITSEKELNKRVQDNDYKGDQKLRRSMDIHSEKLEVFNKGLQNIKNIQTEMKNTITEMKTTLEEINSRLNDTEEWTIKLEDREVEITEVEPKKRKKEKKMKRN